MRKSATLMFAAVLGSSALIAQGPPPGGPGPGGRGPGFGHGPDGPQTVVTGAPYSGIRTTSSTQTLANGTQIKHDQQSKLYRDSLGRVRTETTVVSPDGTTTRTMISIFDPVGGYMITLNPDKLTAVKMALPSSTSGSGTTTPPAPPTGANAPTVVTTDLGTKVINTLACTGVEKTVTIPAGAVGNTQAIEVVTDTWTSTILKVPVLITTNDPRFGTSTTQLTNVTLTEPDASLFTIPSNYTTTTATAPPAGSHFRAAPAV